MSVPDLSGASSLAGAGEPDNLDFRRVLGIFFRTWPFIRPSVRHLVLFVVGSGILFLFGAGMGLLLIGLATTGIMSAKPLGELFVSLYGLDPDVYLNVTTLSDQARLDLAWPTVNTAVVLALVAVSAGYALYYYSVWIFQSINQRMRVRLIEVLQAQSLAYHASAQTGDAIYRVYQDSAMVTAIIRSVFLEPLMFIARYLVGLVIVAAFSPLLALILALVALPIVWLGRFFSGRLRRGFRCARERNADLTNWIQESVQGIRIIKATGSEPARQDAFRGRSEAALQAAFSSRVDLNVLGILAFVAIGVAMISIQSYAAALSNQGAEVFARDLLLLFGFAAWNFGTFSAATARTTDAIGSLGALIRLWGTAQDMAIGLGRVFEIMDLTPDVVDRPGATPLANFANEVRFSDVSFSYLPGRPVLDDVSLMVPAGSITAIVGPTGTGKSTLMSLLLRLADPDSGAITIDGVDIRDVTIDSLRQGISIATQENILFSTSVIENICYAAPDATEEQVVAAAKIACADEFISELGLGYQTPLGERAVKLSSGQRQRIVLARAIVRDTPLLILDEPTAALDARTELRVLENLRQWGAGRCIFLITHRLSTLAHADRVVYLSDGHVVANDSHEALIRDGNPSYLQFVGAEIT